MHTVIQQNKLTLKPITTYNTNYSHCIKVNKSHAQWPLLLPTSYNNKLQTPAVYSNSISVLCGTIYFQPHYYYCRVIQSEH